VGTRRISVYGRQATERLAGELARSGVTIVSGLAKGVDTCAHNAALDAGGRTIAVLGCGVDVVYPPENSALSRRVVDHGALVSEYPLGAKPEARNFPMRNRIIAGLSRGTLVTEADHKSGALITAKFAVEQDRDVYAVPGSIFAPGCQGTNWLIQRSAAKAVTAATDILEDLDVEAAGRQLSMRDSMPLESGERAVLALLGPEPRHVDDLCRAMSLPVADVVASLAMLELKGLARQAGGMSYITSA
jgi:DNA processing protein